MGSDKTTDVEDVAPPYQPGNVSDLSDDDAAIIPKGALDPVYEAKARILNRAVWTLPLSID